MSKFIICIIYILIFLIEFSGSSSLVSFNNYALILLPIMAFLYQLLSRDKKIRLNIKNIPTKFLFIFLLLMIVSLVYTYDKSETLLYIVQFFCILSFALLFVQNSCFWEKFRKILFYISIFVAITVIITTIYPNFLINNFSFLLPNSDASLQMYYSELKSGIYSGILFERTYTAFALSLGIAAFFSEYFSNSKINKLHFVGFIILLIALFSTGKRSLFLISIISFIILSVLNNKNKKIIINTLKIIPVILLLIITVISVFPNTAKVFERLATSLNDNNNNTIDSRKNDFWSHALEMYSEKPLLGYGAKSFKKYISTIRSDHIYDVHNIYIQLLAENGTVGFIVMSIVFSSNYINTIILLRKAKDKESKKLSNFSICIQTLFLIYGLTGNPLYYPGQLLIYMLTIAMNTTIKRMES